MSMQVCHEMKQPCGKKTLNLGPKKTIGYDKNNTVHQYSKAKAITYKDFDTISVMKGWEDAAATKNNSKSQSKATTNVET